VRVWKLTSVNFGPQEEPAPLADYLVEKDDRPTFDLPLTMDIKGEFRVALDSSLQSRNRKLIRIRCDSISLLRLISAAEDNEATAIMRSNLRHLSYS